MTRQKEEFTMILASELLTVWFRGGAAAAFDKIEEWRGRARYVDDENYPVLVQAIARFEMKYGDSESRKKYVQEQAECDELVMKGVLPF